MHERIERSASIVGRSSTLSEQGVRRSDSSAIRKNHSYGHQYNRILHDLENDRRRKEFRCGEMTECIWIHGLPGRGKSHTAFMDELASVGGYDPDKVYDWDLEQEFQCGYEGQEIVIINEFKGPHQIKYGTLLKLIDKWPMKIKRKNPLAAMDFISKKIIITSVFHPKDVQWNLHTTDDLDQLLDRIQVKELFKHIETRYVIFCACFRYICRAWSQDVYAVSMWLLLL